MARPALGTLGTVYPPPHSVGGGPGWESDHTVRRAASPPPPHKLVRPPGNAPSRDSPGEGGLREGGESGNRSGSLHSRIQQILLRGWGGGRCNIQGGEPTAAEAGSPEPRSPLAFPAIPEPRAPHHCGGNAPGSSKSPATCGPLPTPPRALPAHPRRDVEGEGRGGGRARGGVGRNWEVEISCRQPAQPDLPPGPILQVDCADPTDLPLIIS